MVGKLLSFVREGQFSGDMLVLGRVSPSSIHESSIVLIYQGNNQPFNSERIEWYTHGHSSPLNPREVMLPPKKSGKSTLCMRSS